MGEQDIAVAFAGKTVSGEYSTGAGFTETYHPGGAIDYRDEAGTAAGRWSIHGEDFCTFYRNLRGGCFRLRRLGGNCFQAYLTADVAHITEDEDLKTLLVAQFWSEGAPSTCPVVPTA